MYWSVTAAARGPPPIACSACRSSAKFTALRNAGLFRKSGLDELKANIRSVRPALGEEPRAVDAVLRDQPERRVQEDRHQARGPVGLASLDPSDRLVRRRRAEVDVEAVDVVRPRAAVERVSADHDALAGPVLGDAVRACGREDADPLGVERERRRHRAEERQRVSAGKSGAGRVKRTISVSPRATTPVAVAAPARQHVGRADDVAREQRAGRLHRGRQRPVDRAGERARPNRASVAEAEALA